MRDNFDEIYWRDVPARYSISKQMMESFSGAAMYGVCSQIGTFNGGWEYRILPLNSSLSQKGNDRDMARKWKEMEGKRFYIGMVVAGESPVDEKDHVGSICNFSFKNGDCNDIEFIWILDNKTRMKIPLEPDTVMRRNSTVTRGSYSSETNRLDFQREIYDKKGRIMESVIDLFDIDIQKESDYSPVYPTGETKTYCNGRGTEYYYKRKKEIDVPYRNRIIHLFTVPGADNRELFPRLDDKFYTDTFRSDCYSPNVISISMFAALAGVNKIKNAGVLKKYVTEYFKYVYEFLGYPDDTVTVYKDDKENYDNFLINDHTPITSYKCIYALYYAMICMFEKYVDGENYSYCRDGQNEKIWNADCTNPRYRKVLRKFICKLLFDNNSEKLSKTITKEECIERGFTPKYGNWTNMEYVQDVTQPKF